MKRLRKLIATVSIAMLIVSGILACSSEPPEERPTSTNGSNEDSKESVDEGLNGECDPHNLMQAGNFEFGLNIDDSLPDDWQSQFLAALDTLEELFPISDCVFSLPEDNPMSSPMQVYAWSSDVSNPWPDDRPGMGGACICGDGSGRWMVLEINADEFKYDSLHRYAVIAHEYFHVFQIARSGDLMMPVWLVEGGAKTFEELFTQTYFDRSEFDYGLFPVTANGLENPAVFEDYVDVEGDQNYNFSSFMVLALVQAVADQKDTSQEAALKLVLTDYWANLQGQTDWKVVFKDTFGLAPDDFYGLIQQYESEASPEPYYSGRVVSGEQVRALMPSSELKLTDISPE